MSPQDATETAPQAAASPAIGRKLGLALLVIATAQLMLVLDDVRGYSAMHTGLAYLPYVAGVGLASGGFGPRLLGARPARAVIAAGMIICASGLAWYVMALTPASNYYAVMLPAMLAGGVGTGLTFVGCTVTGMRRSPHATLVSRPACSIPACRPAARWAWALWPRSPR